MIDVAGVAHRSYLFPADRATALAYYGDFRNVVSNLTLISLVKSYGNDCYRLVYRSTELGVYRVRIYCDVQVTRDTAGFVLHVDPWRGPPPVEPQAGVSMAQAQGMYRSESVFHAEGNGTRIEYRLSLQAALPVPLGLRLVPAALRDSTAHAVTAHRIHEIVDRFIVQSIGAFERGRLPPRC